MSVHFHGKFSLLLFLAAIVVGLVAIVKESTTMGMMYGVVILISLVSILWSYCAKCRCRKGGCVHYFTAKIANLLPDRKPGKYTLWDNLGLLVPVAVMLIIPQFWLWKNTPLIIVFWTGVVVSVIDLRLFVCCACKNRVCILNKRT
ncbi:MAG: hypothetical protein JXB48_23430 [Candidatus Latescibacteria bacterium]|nr:hypothetical protein [Candidatus Latescibacterota bacterium]